MKISNNLKDCLGFSLIFIILSLFIINYSIRADKVYKEFNNAYNQVIIELNELKSVSTFDICSVINNHSEYSDNLKSNLIRMIYTEYGYEYYLDE